MTINVTYDPPPIPIRSHDYMAWVNGYEELGPFGHGSTRFAAIADLSSQIADDAILAQSFMDEGFTVLDV